MKGKIIAIVATVIAAGFLLAGSASAMNANTDHQVRGNVTLEKSKVIDGAYYAAGDTITIAGTVKGDVYCAGKSVTITGTVEGDVFCAGQNVKVSGTVDENVRVAGQMVTIDGSTSKNVTVFGDVVDIAKSAVIGRDLNGASNTVTVDGKVGRDVTIGGSTISIVGAVGRDIGVKSDNLSIAEGSSVTGWVRYTGRNEASIAKGSVKGEVKYTKQTQDNSHKNAGNNVASTVYMLLAFAVLSLVVVLIAPQQVNAIGAVAQRRLGMSVLVGVFMLLAVPIILVLVAVTFIGVPVTLIAGLVWLLVLSLSGPLFAYYIGRLLLKKQTDNAIYSMLVGAAVLVILYLIPVVNILTGLASLVIGMGMIALYILGHLQKPHYTVK
jgi:hypothetical protein